MFSHAVYNVVHIVGIVLVMSALGGATLVAMTGIARNAAPARGLLAAMHGVGALLILVGGFGMLARLGVAHTGSFPGWIWAKVTIWVLIGAAPFLLNRRPAVAKPMLLALPVLGGLAAYIAIYKPF